MRARIKCIIKYLLVFFCFFYLCESTENRFGIKTFDDKTVKSNSVMYTREIILTCFACEEIIINFFILFFVKFEFLRNKLKVYFVELLH